MAEKTVNDLQRDLRVLFTKGNEALQRDNFDYAIDLFTQILARDPTNFECRKALRAAQQGKAGEGKGFFKKVLVEFQRLVPGNNDVTQALKDISARKTMEKGGYDALADGSGSYRDILKDKDEAVLLEQQNRQMQTEDTAARLITEYESRLKA